MKMEILKKMNRFISILNNITIMKKIIYLILCSILLTSCSETYVSTRDIKVKDGKYVLDGKVFNGSLARIRTIGHPSEQNRVYDLTKVKNGIPVNKEGYHYKKGNFRELKLNTGLKTYVSDLIEFKIDEQFYIEYYTNGKIREKSEITIENGNIETYELNGKSEYFDKEGNLIKVTYYESGKKIKK